MDHILGIGEYAIAKCTEDALITYALGSCVAILMYCPEQKVAAMAHIALPERLPSANLGRHKPAYFADVAVPLLLNAMRTNFMCQPSKLVVHLIGGAESRSEKDPFQVGRRNVEQIKMLLQEQQMRYTAIDVGGHLSRTVTFHLASSALEIKTQEMML